MLSNMILERPVSWVAHTPACRPQPCRGARLAASARMDLKAWRSKSSARLDLLRASASQHRQQSGDRSIRCDAAQTQRTIVCIGEGLFGAASRTPHPQLVTARLLLLAILQHSTRR